MINRLRKLGIVLAIFGLAFVAAGGYACQSENREDDS